MFRDSHDMPLTVEAARSQFGKLHTAAFTKSGQELRALGLLITVKLKEIQQECGNSNDGLARHIDGNRMYDVLGADIADCTSRYLETRGYSLAGIRDINSVVSISSRVYNHDENGGLVDCPLPDISLSIAADNQDKYEVLIHVRYDSVD